MLRSRRIRARIVCSHHARYDRRDRHGLHPEALERVARRLAVVSRRPPAGVHASGSVDAWAWVDTGRAGLALPLVRKSDKHGQEVWLATTVIRRNSSRAGVDAVVRRLRVLWAAR